MNHDLIENNLEVASSHEEPSSNPESKTQEHNVLSRKDYLQALSTFDAAICEALAVGQKHSGTIARPNVAFATYVYSQMCASGISIVRAAPLSRWVHSNFEHWHFGAIAGHARALLEGFLLFFYLIEEPASEDEREVRMNVMHLNDCTRRIELFKNAAMSQSDVDGFEVQRKELQGRLTDSQYFGSLPSSVQKSCLNGKFLMLSSRDELLEKIEFPKNHFNAIFDLLSQHTHILPLSFYRMVPNGRGAGLENDTDRSYIGQSLRLCADTMIAATNVLEEKFPDVAEVRKGIRSVFSPGPRSNRRR